MKKLLVVLFFAFVLRVLWLPENFFFGYEQGRDMLAVKSIVEGNLSLIGPWTSIPGFFHGALSYWLLVPLYIVGSGDPLFIITVLISINVAALYFYFRATEELFGKKVAWLALLIIAVSFHSIIYARWLSNPTLVPAFMSILYFSLVRARKEPVYLVLGALCFGVVFHLQSIVAVSLFPAIILSLLIMRIKINLKIALLCFLAFALCMSTYLIFDIRHEFLMFKGLRDFILSSGGGSRVELDQILIQLIKEAEGVIYYGNRLIVLSFVAFSVGMLAKGKNRLVRLVPWVFIIATPLFFYLVGIKPLEHYLMAVHIFIPVALSISLLSIKKSFVVYLLLAVVVYGNLKAIVTRLPENVGIFLYAAQKNYLGDMKRLVDYVYADSGGSDFSYDYYSIPYWHEDAWRYMFVWYGNGKYKRLPVKDRTEVFYVFVEPDEIQPKYQEDWYKKLNSESLMLNSLESGKLKVEKRRVL